MANDTLGENFLLKNPQRAKALLVVAEQDPAQATRALKDIENTLTFTSTTFFVNELSRVIATLMDYPKIFDLQRDNISKAMARALDRINHPASFQGFGYVMTPASYCDYLGHLSKEDPEYHFAAKEFLEQIQALEKKPELFDQVVTPAMIEQAVLYLTVNANCPVYKYAEELFDIIDLHPQLLEAAQRGVIQAIHSQLERQETREWKI